MKLAVVGSRNFNNEKLLFEVLDSIHFITPITQIVSGGAIGADSLAELWTKKHNIPALIFKPDWAKYGKKAGILRNEDIIKNADFVVAFWDQVSKGTKNSIDRAKNLNKPLQIIYF